MNTLTIILLIYVILDIIVDTYAIIQFKRKGYSLRSIAGRMWSFLSNKPMVDDTPPTPTNYHTNIEIYKNNGCWVNKREFDIINTFCNIKDIYEPNGNGVHIRLDCKSRYVAQTIVDALNEEFDAWHLGSTYVYAEENMED